MSKAGNQSDRVLDLVRKTYDAALDEQPWSGMAAEIARTFDSTSTVLHLRDTQLGGARMLSVTENLTPAAMDAYRAHYWQHDLWVQRGAAHGLSKVVANKDLIADAELEETEFYQDWCRQIDAFYLVGTVFPVSGDEIGILGIHRPRDGRAYDETDKHAVGRFLPHLQRALQIRRRLAARDTERQAAAEAAERSGTATLVVGPNGDIIHADHQAEAVLREGDAIRAVSGRLATARRSATERLTALIREAAETAAGREGGSGGALSIPRPDRLPLTVLVAPFRPARSGFGTPAPAAILFIRDPERPTPASLVLQGLFGLTPAEARIAGALADGRSIEDIAAATGISLNTARTHLKSILAKTGTNRQAQLVAVLLRSVAALAPGGSAGA